MNTQMRTIHIEMQATKVFDLNTVREDMISSGKPPSLAN